MDWIVGALKYCGLELRSPFHWVAGALAALAIYIHPALSGIGTAIFIAYEVLQDKATAAKDILEYLVAYFIAIGAMLIRRIKK